MPGCASAGVEGKGTGRGFAGEVQGARIYEVDGTCAAHTGAGC